MNAATAFPYERPAHVPAERVFDFDMFYDPRIERDVHEGHLQLLEEAPDVFWTPRNAGHWVATRHAEVTTVLKNPAIFSSVNAPFERTQPAMDLPVPPMDMDAPEHRPHRMLLLHFLSTKATRPLEGEVRDLVRGLIDGLRERGACEFRAEAAVPLPARLFVSMMKLDETRYREFAGWVDAITTGGDRARIAPALHGLRSYVSEIIRDRIDSPGADPVSHLLRSAVDGHALSEKRVHEMCCFLFLAGLDTVTKALTFVMNWLARNVEAQRTLRASPDKIPEAVEELLRRLTFVNLARRLTSDFELGGVQMMKDETIICSLAAASNDDRVIACPRQVDFDRGFTPHLAFSTGPHACPGAPLARTELRIFLEEWLRSMPDVRLAPDFVPRCRGGMVMGMEELQLVW